MPSTEGRWRRPLAAGLIAAAACCARPTPAGLLTTEQTVRNFSFTGDEVDYAPDPKLFAPRADVDSAFMVTDPTLGIGHVENTHDPLRGSLYVLLKGSNYGRFDGADFGVFGNLPNMSKLTEAALTIDAVKSMRADSKPGPMDFLISRDRLAGPLVSRYRGVGIFVLVNGVDDLTWVQGFADGAATMELLQLEDAAVGPGAAGDRK